MAESHEPSYYEIALTNRQVIVAFVILLVCLLSAFFSGVWIGRESTARAAEDQIVRTTPPAAAQEGQNLEELEFFGSRNKPTDAAKDRQEAQAPTRGAADTTLLEDLGGSEPAPETRVPPADEPAPDSQARRAEEAGTATSELEPAGRRKKRDRAAEATAPAAAAEPAIPKGSAVIQVFSSADQSQADRIRDRLVGGGYQAYLSPVEVSGHTMYRVRIGPFGSRGDAEKVAEKVRKGYKLDTWVTE